MGDKDKRQDVDVWESRLFERYKLLLEAKAISSVWQIHLIHIAALIKIHLHDVFVRSLHVYVLCMCVCVCVGGLLLHG